MAKAGLPPKPELQRFYRTFRNKTHFGNAATHIIEPLLRDYDFYEKQILVLKSGGRDVGSETARYTLLESGRNDGRAIGVYEVTMDGCVQHVSVLLQASCDKPIDEPILKQLDGWDFVDRHRVLDQAKDLGFSNFRTWLDELPKVVDSQFRRE
ncbi:MAG: hypothetical protein KJ718_02920 [Nanoarchaeota archaeon]|nr:hypothetical protein [Nanoarchaeota archaeon]MBU1051481.1 hypothetical protein [Nanoarchaeota archaeon]MBU1988092.1 hypothetical protein [Nanoarchaeota archaeon]